MKKKLAAFLLALIMVAQVLVPGTSWAIRDSEDTSQPSNNFVQVGMTSAENYPKLTNRVILDIQREATQKARENIGEKDGVTTFNTPYLPGQNIPDKDKPRIVGKVSADFKTKGLDGGTFDWKGVFGTDSNGNPGKAKLVFKQWLNNQETGVSYELEVSKDGTYSWKDWEGQPARIPLYSKGLQPYTYSVYLDQDVSEKVKLLTYRIAGTPGSAGYEKDPETGLNVANIVIDLSIQQVASTKFVSKWYTNLAENSRPPVNGEFNNKMDEYPGYFPFSTKDSGSIIIRNDKMYNSDYEDPGYSEYNSSKLVKTPEVKVTEGLEFADENDETGSPTYHIDEASKTITTLDKKHKFKYDFNYDVINGGKLTMTEILPITFDANEGKFSSITDPKADQQIVKEVEYGKDLTDEVEKPKKDLETFKGWATDKEGTKLATDDDFKNITEAKTFYAVWDNNDIVAEELEVKESFKDKTGYVNDFVPKLETLGKQIKIKDEKGIPQPLDSKKHGFEILDDSENSLNDPGYKDYLYKKLKEDPDTEVSRIVNIKAKVKFLKSNTSKEVIIPIKVIKNIYEAKTKEGRPIYVPDNYKKVILNPTTTAKDPQKTYYYVNPEAMVKIPGNDPVGVGDNLFIGWKTKDTPDGEVFKLDERHKFAGETEIKAKYTKDVIPQEGDKKPDTVPDSFVKVTFNPTDKGVMEGAKIFWVKKDRDVIIPVKDPVGKQYQTFDKWKMGEKADGKEFNRTEAHRFSEKETTITATYNESPNIIPFDPTNTDDPKIVRPDGYVKVTFEAEKGLKLTEQKAYYVKANAGIKLGNDELKKPAYTEEDGYKFEKWDKEDATEIKADDIVVKAISKPLGDVIPANKEDGSPNEKPDGYITVTFKTTDKGGNIEKVLYLNPNKAVALEAYAPAVIPKTGYDSAGWDRPIKEKIQYEDKTVITAQFNEKGAVIPKTNPDGSENKQPEGYKIVTFVIEPDEGGKIVDDEVKIYYVNPDKDVVVPQPKTQAYTGYVFEKWDKDTTTAKKYEEDTTVRGNFKKLDDIIPEKKDDGTPNQKPEGYVTLTFEKGDHGKLEGKTLYYVNPKAGKTLAEITKPTVKPEVGWKQSDIEPWNKSDEIAINDNITVIAQYEELPAVVPEKDDEGNNNTIPDDYIKVTFSTETNGKIKDTEDTTKVVYVNPNKAVKLKNFAPEVTPNTGYDFADWDTQISKRIQYSNDDIIKALYNKKGDVIPQINDDGSTNKKPDGYFTVTFLKGDHGELSGKTVYYVKPNTKVTVPAPTVKPNTGWKQKDGDDAWDKKLTQTFTENTEISAKYKPLDDIIPQENTDESDKPEGYVTVKFVADENGSLSGKTVYYVNPEKEVDLTTTANGIVKKPNVGYVADGGKWTNEDGTAASLNAKFDQDKTFVYHFLPYKDVIPAKNLDQKPEGYVKVEFIAGENGKLKDGDKTYYVNPLKNITVGSTDLPIPEPNPNKNYKFDDWYEKIDQTEPIKTDKKFVARFKLAKVTMTYEADDKTSGDVPEALSYDVGTEITLAGGNDLKKDNYSLTGWEIDGTFYAPGAKFKLEKNTTAKAVWKEGLHTVEFDTKGGTHISTRKVEHGKTIGNIDPPTKEGSLFIGWTLDGNIIKPEEYKVTKDITLVAKYSKDVIPADENGNKPEGTPDDFVKVKFDPTAEGSLEGPNIFYVNPDKEVTIPVKTPSGKDGKSFKRWKIGDTVYDPTKPRKFESETTITASYVKNKDTGRTQVEDKGIISTPIVVDKGATIDPKTYGNLLDPSDPERKITKIEVTANPDTSVGGVFTSALVTVTLDDGSKVNTKVLAYVKEPCDNTCPNPGDNPGGGGYIPTPDPNPTLPDDGDDEKEPEDKEKTPDEENGKDEDSDKEKEDNPDKDKDKTPEKPGDKDPKKPGQNQPPVKNDSKKKQGQTGTKIVNTIGQTGTKVINQVKNFLNPTTGIISNYGLYIGLMAASSVGLFFTRDKKNEDEE